MHTIPEAGHWVQQEFPDQVNTLLVDWLTAQFAGRPLDSRPDDLGEQVLQLRGAAVPGEAVAHEPSAGAPHAGREVRVPQQRRDRHGHGAGVLAVHQQPRLARTQRVRHPADVTCDDGTSDGLRLDEDDAERLDLRPPRRSRHGIAKTSPAA